MSSLSQQVVEENQRIFELDADLEVHIGVGRFNNSGGPSLDCDKSNGLVSASDADNYDTDFFGGCHDFDHNGYTAVIDDEEEFEAELSWRLDPIQSHSDWTIKIISESSNTNSSSDTSGGGGCGGDICSSDDTDDSNYVRTEKIYHVHKNILSVGPRKSEYFCSLFRCTAANNHLSSQHGGGGDTATGGVVQLRETESKTSTIVLEEMAAKAFPRLLDFAYSSTDTLYITTENAIALRYLAQYFGMRLLHKKVMEFLRKDITLSNMNTYVCDSYYFQDTKISNLVADTCAANIIDVSPTSSLLETVTDPNFFLRVISSSEIDTCDTTLSSHLSLLVAAYCNFHKDDIDEDVFRRLTHRNHMPVIDKDASLLLLEIEADIMLKRRQQPSNTGEGADDGVEGGEVLGLSSSSNLLLETNKNNLQNGGGGGDAGNGDGDEVLSCLQKRCIKVIALHWKDLMTDDEAKVQAAAVFEKLPSSVLLEVMDKSLSIARQRLEEATKSMETQRLRLEQEYDIRLSKALERYKREQQILERVQRDTSERISLLRMQLADRDRQLAEYRRELSRFCRVPPTHSFTDIKRSTYHHLSQPEPFDHDSLIGQYGSRRPTALPRFGDRTEDGYLFLTQRGGLKERWPVYFYRED